MQKSKIEWTDYTWNPIKGICPVGCWYCYGKRIYERFKLNPIPRVEKESFFGEVISLMKMKPTRIFVCSTFEIFHPITNSPCPWYPKITWRDAIFNEIKNAFSQHTFQILTKFPQNIDRPMPDNVWLGTTVTMGSDLWRIRELMKHKAIVRFVSYEPLLQEMPSHCLESMDEKIDWLIVGRMTGHGKKHDPNYNYLIELIGRAKRFNVPIFLKNNLKEIFGEPLIQEFPNM